MILFYEILLHIFTSIVYFFLKISRSFMCSLVMFHFFVKYFSKFYYIHVFRCYVSFSHLQVFVALLFPVAHTQKKKHERVKSDMNHSKCLEFPWNKVTPSPSSNDKNPCWRYQFK